MKAERKERKENRQRKKNTIRAGWVSLSLHTPEKQGLQTAWVPERSRDPWRDWDDTQDPEEEDEARE